MSPQPSGAWRAVARPLALLLLLSSPLLSACRAPYVPRVPLETASLPQRIDAARSLASSRAGHVAGLDFACAASRLRRHNPRVVEARARALAPQALSRTPTPLPNPTIALGPVLLSGLDGVTSSAWGLEAALGWKAILGGKRQMLDSLLDQEARAAAVRAVAVEREEYLGLRRDWLDSALRAREEQVRAELLAGTREARDGVEELVQAQSAAAVDLVLLDLDVRRLSADQIDAEAQTTAARAALAQRIGAESSGVGAPSMATLPSLPTIVPPLDRLRETALAGHPGLDRLRADYAVAEQKLRLEVSRAIPDLGVGGTYEREAWGEGVNRFGLPLGIELPLFDRNQQGIAEACARRDALRTQFEAEYTRILGEIEAARALLDRRRARAQRIDDDVSPAAIAALDTGKRALAAGETDALRFVDLLRSARGVEREQIAALREVYLAWASLERAVGGPLLRFPGEPTPAPIRKEDS